MLEMAADDAELEGRASSGRWRALERELGRLQEEALFTGEYDAGPAVVGVHAGAGGTDSQDWAEMLLRMYLRWAESRGFKAELLEATPGEEAGLKSATFTLAGDNAYGIMQAEKGVHRLVRLSPFDSAHRRQTSFAQVEVSPLVDDDVDVEIDETDLRIDTYRSPGRRRPARQQDRLGRAHHAPADRDRGAVPERALPAAEQGAGDADPQERACSSASEELREAALAKERGEAQDIAFGSQIRSYVLHPYTMVNDHRTNIKIGNAQGVLDGDLDEFIRAELLRRRDRKVVGMIGRCLHA